MSQPPPPPPPPGHGADGPGAPGGYGGGPPGYSGHPSGYGGGPPGYGANPAGPGGHGAAGSGSASGPGPVGPGVPGPSAPPPRPRRTGMYVAIGCVVLLLGLVVLGGGGIALWLGTRDTGETRGSGTTGPADPSETAEPAEGTPSGDPVDDPLGEESDEPGAATTEPTVPDDGSETSISVRIVDTGEFSEIEDANGETMTPKRGVYIGIQVEITNHNDEDIGLSTENFHMYDAEGTSYPVRYGAYTTSGPQIAPGETATASIYADARPGTEIVTLTYSDPVATGGNEAEIPIP